MRENVPLSRRKFVAAAALGVLGCSSNRIRQGNAMEPLVYVGTYTNGGESEGIYLFRFDPGTGTLRPVETAAAGENPSFLVPHSRRPFLYAVNEVTEFEGRPSGAVSALSRDAETGSVSVLNRQPSHGGAPCYLSIDGTGQFVLVANYAGGSVAVLPIRDDGSLAEASSVVQHQGSGADPDRQSSPHAHCVILDPSNRFALVADLGIDRIMVYRFDARAGTLSPAAEPGAALKPGAGPRHLAFHPAGQFVYVVNELDSTVAAFRFHSEDGSLTELQTLSTLPAETAVENSAADLHFSPSGRFLYASNRGHNSIAVFSVDPAAGTLERVQVVSTEGNWPRNFGLDPSGGFLFVANQRSNSIVSFRVDPLSGRLTPTGQRVNVPSPVCIRFEEGGSAARGMA